MKKHAIEFLRRPLPAFRFALSLAYLIDKPPKASNSEVPRQKTFANSHRRKPESAKITAS